MTADLRVRIARALADHAQGDLGLDTDHYPPERWLCCADAVITVLDQEFPRPLLALDPPPEMSPDDVAAWHAAWAETFSGDAQDRATVLPPNAVAIRRRTPEQRRAYLLDRRDEAIANGIPEDLIDMLIADTEAGEPA